MDEHSGIHRDDLPLEVAEEIVKRLQDIHPGATVRFVGDGTAGLPQDARKQIADMQATLQARADRSLAEGTCFDCGRRMPGDWPPPQAADSGAELPDGWSVYEGIGVGDTVFLVCPDCDAEGPEVDLDEERVD